MTQSELVSALTKACVRLKLPHPLHLHISGLGLPGNYENALAALKHTQLHLAHLQFYSYGGDSWKTFSSEAEKVAAEANKKPDVTFDIGQVTFGDSVTITADEALEQRLKKLGDVGHYTYKPTSGVNSIQWAAGLELALHTKDPWKVSLSTDSPNGGPFTSYPKIIAWLMDKEHRDQQLAACHPWASQRTTLPSIGRELSLQEVATMTRAGPAKRLGLSASLEIGSKANVALYLLKPDEKSGKKVEAAFASAAYLIKAGEIVVKDGEITKEVAGKTLSWRPQK
jgi:formylmethanofuran dehydrogenase subunit A